jgi:NitT/TauT family transport system permease protein
MSWSIRRVGRQLSELPHWTYSATVLICVFLLWEVAVRAFDVPIYLIPRVSSIFVRLIADWQPLLHHSIDTVNAILVGFLLSIVVSIPLAALLSQLRWFEKAVYPLLVASQTVPKVAIAPLLVVWFGFGVLPKILIVFLICFFPIVVDTMTGLRSVSREVIWLSRSMGASHWKTFSRIRVPAALPHIFSGLKIASTLAVVGAVVGEFVGSDSGLGYQLIVANGTMDVEISFAVIILLSVIGIVLFGIVGLFERLLLPWHVSQRKIGAASAQSMATP